MWTKRQYIKTDFWNAIKVADSIRRSRFKQHWKTIAKNMWYPFSASTKWLTFPCYSYLSIMKNPGNNSTDNHKMPLKGGKKRADCLRILTLQRGSTGSPLGFLFVVHVSSTTGATNARDPFFSPNPGQGWLKPHSTLQNQQPYSLQR